MTTVVTPASPSNAPSIPASYRALWEKASEIGWPVYHELDLTEKDALICAEMGSDEPFLWILREAGTTLLRPSTTLDPLVVQSRLYGLERARTCLFFWWNGDRLEELSDAEEACFVVQDHVMELRCRENV